MASKSKFHVKKKLQGLRILSIFILLSIILSGCYDPLPVEKQEAEIIDTTTTQIENQELEEIIIINNTSGTSEDKEKYPEKYEDEEPFNKEDFSTVTYSVDFTNINENESIKRKINKGDLIDIYTNGVLLKKLILANLPNQLEAWISFDGKSAEKYREGNTIEIREPYYVNLDTIIYNDEENDLSTNYIILEFFVENREHYPDYLIEKDIGLHQYKESKKGSSQYIARYSDVIVTITKINKFAKFHSNQDNVILFESSRIYKEPETEGVYWMTTLEGQEYEVHVNKNMESVIRMYIDKFPSYITEKTYCRTAVYLEEREEKTIEFDNQIITAIPIAISDSKLEAKISFNGESAKTYSNKDVEEFENNTLAIIDDVQINYLDSKDRIKICLV